MGSSPPPQSTSFSSFYNANTCFQAAYNKKENVFNSHSLNNYTIIVILKFKPQFWPSLKHLRIYSFSKLTVLLLYAKLHAEHLEYKEK